MQAVEEEIPLEPVPSLRDAINPAVQLAYGKLHLENSDTGVRVARLLLLGEAQGGFSHVLNPLHHRRDRRHHPRPEGAWSLLGSRALLMLRGP